MQTVLITGANRGLGLELSRQYAEAGWQVWAVARSDSSALDALLERDNVRRIRADITREADRAAVVTAVGDTPIDVLINNAGQFGPKRQAEGDFRQTLGQLDEDIWASLMRVNVIAPTLLTEELIDRVGASDQRKIVFISSVMGSIHEAGGGLYAYRSSKSALNNVAANLARDLAERSIRVLVVCPGWVRTEMGGPGASLSPEVSIAGVRQQIEVLDEAMSGTWVRYNGDLLPW